MRQSDTQITDMTFNSDIIAADDIIHLGDTDTLISLEDDKIVLQAGSLEMISVIEAATDEVVINDAAGDINFRVEAVGEPNALFVQGSDGLVGVKTGAPEVELHLLNTGTEGVPATLGRTTFILQNSDAAGNFTAMAIIAGNTGRSIIDCGDTDDIDAGSFQYHHNDNSFRFFVNAGTEGFRINSSGDISTGNVAPLAQLHVDQASTTAAEPVLLLDQADVSEEFVEFIGTAAAATLTQSIVAEADVTTATRQGFVKVFVTDIGNQITDQAYFMPLFTLA